MKRVFRHLLIVSLMLSSVATGTNLTPVWNASAATVAGNSQTSANPVHQSIFFNDFQVVGLDDNGQNWVNNDQFILPPHTPIDIDITQLTYGDQTTVSQNSVSLDGTELPEFQQQSEATGSSFVWKVPRFTIPVERLSPGTHTLTFVAKDGKQRASTVNVRFLVQASQTADIYQGKAEAGKLLASGTTITLIGTSGAEAFSASVAGTWKLSKQGETTLLKGGYGRNFDTGTLEAGAYQLLFHADDPGLEDWQATIHIGEAEIYQGTDETGQLVAANQKIVAPAAPSTVSFYSKVPGYWTVSGTGQTEENAQRIDVKIPVEFSGMTLTVSFEPYGDKQHQVSMEVQIPGTMNACDPSTATARMDIMIRNNSLSSLLFEQKNIRSSTTAVTLYQDPIYQVWIATDGNHLRFGREFDDEGPGIWTINGVVATSDQLSWDHTALLLNEAGTFQINYYSRLNPGVNWCGSVTIVEDSRPLPSSDSCEVGDSGTVPAAETIYLETDKGRKLKDGDEVTIESVDDLEEFSRLTLTANHAVLDGKKKVEEDNHVYRMPNVEWEYEEVGFGEKQKFSGAPISSENRVEVVFNDKKVLKTFDNETDGARKRLNLADIIEENDNKPGTYTIRVWNELHYKTCELNWRGDYYEKDVDTATKEQEFSATIVLE
ncbi:hypothetical protein [Brevibacillus fulvus]|uniref:Uncharacterized protein n=1 Tax=Brevibacillus fulvus TaxID=1125967 RepID=A0A939BR64_9BACL|nr:hypothetical protein [Brevibacillus fulvus]MBM7589262.1 hypothetical protein [Brevibacillus fulvus]